MSMFLHDAENDADNDDTKGIAILKFSLKTAELKKKRSNGE